MAQRSRNFYDYEFRCKCRQCAPKLVPDALIEILQDLRDHFDRPVKVHSGHRCPEYNARVGGATGSKHMEAIAADVTVQHISPNEVQRYLLSKYPDTLGIGRYNTFTHVDVRPGKARWDNRR